MNYLASSSLVQGSLSSPIADLRAPICDIVTPEKSCVTCWSPPCDLMPLYGNHRSGGAQIWSLPWPVTLCPILCCGHNQARLRSVSRNWIICLLSRIQPVYSEAITDLRAFNGPLCSRINKFGGSVRLALFTRARHCAGTQAARTVVPTRVCRLPSLCYNP